jgi:hypothetical protein
MKNFLLISLLCLTGCATRILDIEGFEDNTRFRIVNRTGMDLHNLKLTFYVVTYGDANTFVSKNRFACFTNGCFIDSTARVKSGIQRVSLEGSAKEGSIGGQYFGGVERIK